MLSRPALRSRPDARPASKPGATRLRQTRASTFVPRAMLPVAADGLDIRAAADLVVSPRPAAGGLPVLELGIAAALGWRSKNW